MNTQADRPEPIQVAVVDAETDLCTLDEKTHECPPKVELFTNSKELTLAGCFKEGRRALAHLPQLRPDIALINSCLPDMSGVECARRLSMAGKDLRLMMTAKAMEGAMVLQALMAGARGILIQPYTMADLAQGLLTLQQEGVFLCARATLLLVEFFHHAHAAQGNPEMFTPRETEILTYLLARLSDREI